MTRNGILILRSLGIAPYLFVLTVSTGFASDTREARASLVDCQSPEAVVGSATLKEKGSVEGIKEVQIRLEVKKLAVADGKHAVHIHQKADCQPCSDAGGHFDPGPNGNPNPDGNHPFHMGDLINLEVHNGEGSLETVTTRVTLSPGPLSIFDEDGSAFIIHVNEDTFCPDGPAPGCAGGGRAACGVIERRNKGGDFPHAASP